MLKITKGKTAQALKVVVYGSEGIGKTTFSADAPDPLFIDTEGSTAHMDVRRIEKPESWDDLVAIVKEVAQTPDICKTLVLDTADWAEQLCVAYVCQKYNQSSIESFGYGRGYVYLAEEFARLLSAFDEVIAAGIHVIITAHAKMRKFEQPDEQGAYDRWEMKLSKHVSPLLKEWCDMLLFLNFRNYAATTESNAKKAQGGKRVIYTTHHPCWDAKNRQDLPEEMSLEFKNIAHLFSLSPTAETEKPIDRLRKMMEEAGVTEEQIQTVVADKGHYPKEAGIDTYSDKFISGWLIKYWPQVTKLIKETSADAQ